MKHGPIHANKEDFWNFVEEETERIQYGKLFIEITVMNGKMTNMQAETRRSKNINHQ